MTALDLIDRLIRDIARLRGLTIQQTIAHYLPEEKRTHRD